MAGGVEGSLSGQPQRVTATPMSYRGKDGRQYVVVAAGSGANAELMAFAL